MAIYARLENGTYAEVTGVYDTDGTEITEIFQGDRLVYSATNEIYGTVPLYYDGKGIDLADYLISGNALQDGTPSSDAPVDAAGCGVRMGNLWDEDYTGITGSIKYVPVYVGEGSFTLSTTTPYDRSVANLFLLSGNVQTGASTPGNGSWLNHNVTMQSDGGYITIAYRNYANTISPAECKTMLNLGSTALPYEPYGYKLPLTVNGTEYPIYLGQVETTRRIKKLVLTGEENWTKSYATSNTFYCSASGYLRQKINITICSHYTSQVNIIGAAEMQDGNVSFYAHLLNQSNCFYVRDSNFATVADLKSYLAAQYANGTPVTVWYVLATPETGIVNEPLMKIGDYSDTVSFAQAGVTIPTVNGANVLDMASHVKPSEVYVKGKGIKPTGYGQLTDVNGVNILDKDGRPIYVHGQ